MTMTQFGAVQGTDATDLGKQIAGVLMPFWEKIEFVALLGSDYHVDAPTEGAAFTDLSGNGHTLTQTSNGQSGARLQALHFIGNGNNYLTTSFTAEYLADSVGKVGEFAWMAWAIAPNTENNDFVINAHAAGSYSGKYVQFRAATNFDCTVAFNDVVEFDSYSLGNPVDTARATEYKSWLAGWREEDVLVGYNMVGQEYGIYEALNDNITGSTDIGGGAFRLCFSGGTGLNFKVAALVAWNTIPTPSEAKYLDRKLRAVLAHYGVTDFA